MSIEERPDISAAVDAKTSDVDVGFELQDGGPTCEVQDVGPTCEVCHKRYKSRVTLMSHRRFKHPSDKVEVRCASCEKIYSSLVSLQKHVRYKHRYQDRCKLCYRAFPTPHELKGHALACSKRDSPCPNCGKVFISQFSLRTHMNYKHPEGKANWCKLCRRAFSSPRGLVNHAGIVHPPSGTNCVECEKVFITAAGLRSHRLYKHTAGDAQTRCTHCRRMFADRPALNKHLKSHHDKRFVCRDCSCSYMTSEQLVHHVVIQHQKHVRT